MTNQLTKSFLLICLFSFTFQTKKKIDTGKELILSDQVKSNFITNAQFLENSFSALVPEYTLQKGDFDSQNNDWKSFKQIRWRFLFENKNKGEHMISVWLMENLEDSSFELMFSKVKTNNIRKKMDRFDQSEMRYQMSALQNLMRNIVNFNDYWEFNNIYFNMIQDIRRKILEKTSRSLGITFQEHQTPYSENSTGTFIYYLMSNESYLGKFEVYSSETQEPAYIGKMPIETNHVISIGLSISQKNTINSGWLTVPVISDSPDQLDKTIDQILTVLTMEAFFNNTNELSKEIITFLRKKISTIEISTISSDQSQGGFVMQYSLKFQYASLELKITHSVESDLSLYTISVYHPNEKDPVLNFSFKRMSKSDLIAFLVEQKFDKIFKSAYDDITEMFLKKFEESKLQLSCQDKLMPYTYSPMFGTNSIGYKNKDIVLKYQQESSKNQKVTVRMSSALKNLNVEYIFNLKSYSRKTVKNIINGFYSTIIMSALFK